MTISQEVIEARHREIINAARQDFLDSTRESIDFLENLAISQEEIKPDTFSEMSRVVHNIKGNSFTFNRDNLSKVVSKMEVYTRSLKQIDSKTKLDILHYSNALRKVFEKESEFDEEKLEDLLESLPCSQGAVFSCPTPTNFRIVLITGSSQISNVIAHNLAPCGHSISVLTSPWQALRLAITAPPDLLITSVSLKELGGIDLILALRAIRKVQDQHFAILASPGEEQEDLSLLPDDVSVINTGETFQDDVRKVVGIKDRKATKRLPSSDIAKRPPVAEIHDLRTGEN